MNPSQDLPPLDPQLLSRILDAVNGAECYEVVLQLLCAAGVVYEYALFDTKHGQATPLSAKLLASAFQFASERAAKLARKREAQAEAEGEGVDA